MDISDFDIADFNVTNFNITIVGLGLLGGSMAMALRDLNPRNLWGIDNDEATIKFAEDNKIIGKGYSDSKIPLQKSDIVIICLYPDQIANYIKDNIAYLKKGAIVTDIAGIKSEIVEAINNMEEKQFEFISGHPMAGNEHSGILHANKEMFKNANYIITPSKENTLGSIEFMTKFIKCMGFKNIIKVAPKDHDRIIALTSHLTHVIAVSLVNSNQMDIDTKLFIGGSFKDASRVALINSRLWPQLLISNKSNVVEQIELFEGNIREMKKAILDEDKNLLEELFQEASERRREIL